MATSVTLNSQSYVIPGVSDSNWGEQVSAYLIAIASSCLQKSGGAFTLTQVVDFGGAAGLKASYWSTRAASAAATGVLRLSNAESVVWRNSTNSADLALTVDASNQLTFNGNPLTTLALGAANTVLKMDSGGTATEYGLIADANVDAAAGIAYSKLNLAGGIVNADVNASAAIVYNKLDLSGSLVDADVAAGAGIAMSKLEVLTADKMLVSNGSGVVAASSVDAGQVDHLANVSSDLQEQLDAKQDSSTAVTLTGTQTLTDKTLTAPTITTPIIDDYLDINEETAPGTPSAGKVRVYAKTDKKLYKKTSDGIEASVGGSGSGEKNYIANPDDSGAWTASAGGIAVSTETTAGNLPELSKGSAIKFLRASGSDYVRYRFTIDEVDKSKALKLAISQRYAGAAGDYTITVHSNTASDYSGSYTACTVKNSSVPAGNLTWDTQVDTTTADYYEVRVNGIAGTTALYLSGFLVGPGKVVNGARVSGPTVYTPTSQGFGTLGTTNIEWRQSGDVTKLSGKFTVGTPTAAEARIYLPPGQTVASVGGSSTTFVAGHWTRNNTSNPGVKHGTVLATPGNTYINFSWDDYDQAMNPVSAQLGNAVVVTGEAVYFEGEVVIPIVEWAGGVAFNAQSDAQEAVIAYNPANASSKTSNTWHVVPYTTEEVDTANCFSSGVFTARTSGYFRFEPSATITGTAFTRGILALWKNGSEHTRLTDLAISGNNYTLNGSSTLKLEAGDTVDVRVYATDSAAYIIVGAASSSSTRIIVTRVSVDGSVIGFGAATATSMGLVKGGTVPGSTAGTAIAAGYVGEYKESTGLFTTPTSGQRGDATTLTLSAGVWDVQACMVFSRNGATYGANPLFNLSVVTVSGNSATGEVSGVNNVITYNATGSQPDSVSLTTPSVRILSDGTNLTIAGVTTTGQVVRAKVYPATYSTATPVINGVLRATRIA